MMVLSDARQLAVETQNYLRQRAITLRKQGERIGIIANYLGVSPDTVSRWWRAYQTQGETALCQQQRGRKEGECRRLSLEPTFRTKPLIN
jgi:transposase